MSEMRMATRIGQTRHWRKCRRCSTGGDRAESRASSPIWLASFRINERKVADYRAGRVFLAGDAAHVHSPAGGQGMNTGMQDACNLAWKLALVCRGLAGTEPLLESYSIERSAVGRQVLADAGRLTTTRDTQERCVAGSAKSRRVARVRPGSRPQDNGEQAGRAFDWLS